MEAPCPGALDPEVYVEKFLEAYYPGLNVRQSGHKLLRLRDHPISREVQLASNTMALIFHPDKGIFTTWITANFRDVELEVVLKAKMKLASFWMQVQQTKETLIHFDEAWYQQVPATHPHTHKPTHPHTHTPTHPPKHTHTHQTHRTSCTLCQNHN